MEALGMILSVVGIIIAGYGGIWLLIVTFSESILWGLGCLFIPFVAIFFLIMHWDEAAAPFGVSVLGWVIIGVASLMTPGAMV